MNVIFFIKERVKHFMVIMEAHIVRPDDDFAMILSNRIQPVGLAI